MKTQIVEELSDVRYVLIVAATGADKCSTNYTCSKADLYQLYISLKNLFSEND